MENKKKVLIYPAGSESAINVFNALKYNIHFELYGASMVSNHARFIYDDNHYFEGNLNINDENFINIFNSLINKYKIDFIICTHDEVIKFLLKNQKNINAVICSSPYETAVIAGNKKLTAECFANKEYMPKIYDNIEDVEYPTFVKPYYGAGGKGTKKINTKSELIEFTNNKSDLLFCEYLPGNEYTVDCFTDRNGKLIFSQARTRERVTNGIAYRSNKIDDNNEFLKIAKDINKTLTFRGAWFFQLKEDKNGKLKLMEICVRQAGTMLFFKEYGFNFPALTLFDFMGHDILPIMNDCKITLDRCIHNSFKIDYLYNDVYIDFDDTIIIDNKVNTLAIKFLYQAHNDNKKIYLLTKHSTDIYEDLKRYCISPNLFDQIYVLEKKQLKSDYIKRENSIFIDNYFKERLEVKEKLGIPVFDVDAIECLIDDSKI